MGSLNFTVDLGTLFGLKKKKLQVLLGMRKKPVKSVMSCFVADETVD